MSFESSSFFQRSELRRKNGNTSSPVKKCKLCHYFLLVFVLGLLGFLVSIREGLYPAPKYDYTLAVGVIVALESSYMEEWMSHHYAMGVDQIVIFDNNKPTNQDEKGKMRTMCSRYGEKCNYIDWNLYDNVACVFASDYLCYERLLDTDFWLASYLWNFVSRRQGMAWKELYKKNHRKFEWIGMIDVDEFLVTKDNETQLSTVFGSFESSINIVRVGRYTFGPNHHEKRPEKIVRASYCMREVRVVHHKGFARSRKIFYPGISNHHYISCNIFSNMRNSFTKWYDETGVVGDVLYTPQKTLVINHYLTKSVEEYMERRSRASVNYIIKANHAVQQLSESAYTYDECPNQKLWRIPPYSLKPHKHDHNHNHKQQKKPKQLSPTMDTPHHQQLTSSSTVVPSSHPLQNHHRPSLRAKGKKENTTATTVSQQKQREKAASNHLRSDLKDTHQSALG